MLGGWRSGDRRFFLFHPLLESLALGGAGLGLVLWIGSIAHKSIHYTAADMTKPVLRTPTPAETGGYGDLGFDLAYIKQHNQSVKSQSHLTKPSQALKPDNPIGALGGAGSLGGAGAGGATGAIPPADPTLEKEQADYQAAIQKAKTGNIRFYVPPEMTVKEPETVVVGIYGPTASEKQRQDFKATGSGSLKVITPMLVTLSQPDNPGSFKIEEDPKKAGILFLPDDSSTEWSWTVTPLKPAEENRKLVITAYLVFDEKLPNGSPMEVQVSSYTATVAVKVQPRWERFKDWMSENWEKVLKYVIPAGTGSAIILWLIAKFAGKPKEPEEKEKEKEKEPVEEDDDDEDDLL